MSKNTLYVNLFAGPGSGKSTIAAGVFSKLKLHHVDCELVTEFAKDLVWEKREHTFGNQIYILGKQHHRLFRIKDQVDVVITDSPLLMSKVYNQLTGSSVKTFDPFVTEVFKSFNNKNYFINRMSVYNPNGRNQTAEEALALDLAIKNCLTTDEIAFTDIKGDPYAIDIITDEILNFIK